MTINIAQPGHISTKAVAGAFAGAVLAGAAGFGIAAVVLDEASVSPSSVENNLGGTVDGGGDNPGFSDPNGFSGTDREVRSFMHRR